MKLHIEKILKKASNVFFACLLSAALYLMNAMSLGCDSNKEQPVLYGPPPSDVEETNDIFDVDDADVAPSDILKEDISIYYGPVDSNEEETLIDAKKDTPVVVYGPPPDEVDTVEDVKTDTHTDNPVIIYGPVDIVADSTEKDCEPVVVYGPKPCASDEECKKEYGQYWYCNFENYFPDGCGGQIKWPVCENYSVDYGPQQLYGPQS